MTSTNTNQNNIYPKSCVYNCGIQIFWNTATSEYWEVFTKKKHICPNRVNKPVTSNTSATSGVSSKPTYYNTKNHGPLLLNQRCLIPSNYYKDQ